MVYLIEHGAAGMNGSPPVVGAVLVPLHVGPGTPSYVEAVSVMSGFSKGPFAFLWKAADSGSLAMFLHSCETGYSWILAEAHPDSDKAQAMFKATEHQPALAGFREFLKPYCTGCVA